MAKQKFYVVWKGFEPGVYSTWEDCLIQTKGFKGAAYKSFKTKAEAEQALVDGPDFHKKTKNSAVKTPVFPEEVTESISVDAACSGNPGKMEYQGVHTLTGAQLFHKGPYAGGTNNIGEFLALVHALAWLQQKKLFDMPIYSDSRTAMAWVRKGQCNTKLMPNQENKTLFDLIKRAEKWLKTNRYKNPILKWETKSWGEIPADFGRK